LANDQIQQGLRVLVIEDEILIGLLLEDMITELGGEFIGPFVSLATALEAVRQDNFDVALVDINLGSERADDVAAVLAGRGVPFALASGGPDTSLGLGQTTVLQKPFLFDDLAAVLHCLSASHGRP
jgi:DNA-binding response OmpR family regulator